MIVWLRIDGDIYTEWLPIFVSERREAHTLSSADAQQAIRKMDINHHEYKWEAVPAPGKDQRVIRGEKKPTKK